MLMQTTYQAATPRPAMRAPQGSRTAPPRPGAANLVDQMDLMGAPMPFTRNAEIYGESVMSISARDRQRVSAAIRAPPSPHPRRLSHPDCRSVLTLIVARQIPPNESAGMRRTRRITAMRS
jgi:hypothetical protein